MSRRTEGPIIPAMTCPSPTSKVLLVEDRRRAPESRAATVIRRFRLARLRFDARPAESERHMMADS
jgi:hypothetical protein